MITMLYEKNLNRKILGAQLQPQPDTSGETNGCPAKTSWQAYPQTLLQNFLATCERLFSRGRRKEEAEQKPPVQQAASMGKILNLMR